MQPGIEALTVRIVRLERANRRLKTISAGNVLAAVALVSVAFGGKPRTIEAEKIVIVDSHGRPRMIIGTPQVAGAAVYMGRDEPAIWFSDERGSDRAILASDGLYLAGATEKPLVSITSAPERPLWL